MLNEAFLPVAVLLIEMHRTPRAVEGCLAARRAWAIELSARIIAGRLHLSLPAVPACRGWGGVRLHALGDHLWLSIGHHKTHVAVFSGIESPLQPSLGSLCWQKAATCGRGPSALALARAY